MKFDAVLIAGPTASGKTTAALQIAEEIGGAIVNADSMQIYHELHVLTARPTDEQMACVPHHLFGHVSVHDRYSAGRYLSDAVRTLGDIRRSGRVPMFVGGTGLYFLALTDGLARVPPIPIEVRVRLRERLETIGVAALHAELAIRDPVTAATLKSTDPHRVLRAFEVLDATGRPLSEWQQCEGRAPLAGLNVAKFVLDVSRDELRARIEQRFRIMLASGARAEAAALTGLDLALPASKILGLRELNRCAAGEIGEAEAESLAVTRTQQFAKRQRTWFRNRMADWFKVQADDRCNFIAEILRSLK